MPVGIYQHKSNQLFQIGHPQLNTGKTRFKKGHSTWNKGISFSKETRIKMSLSQGGSGVIDLIKKRYIHTTWTKEYRQWRNDVFKRDNFTCIWCGDSKRSNLQADHIKQWVKYPELRFELSNGQTLCKECHKQKTREEIRMRAVLKSAQN